MIIEILKINNQKKMKYLEDLKNIFSLDKYLGKYILLKECSVWGGGGCFENIVNILLLNIYYNVGKN